ncbi:MAG: penicillin-binding protein [Bacilli bacterium]|nr:penicillin-binding protein [Bacilli bacterium]
MNTRNKKQNWLFPKKVFIVFLVFIFVLFVQLIHLSLFTNLYGINMREFSLNRNTKSNTIYATRGSIFDRDGNFLAINVTSYTVIAYLSPKRTGSSETPLHVTDAEYTAYKLAPLLNMSVESLTELMSKDLYQVELGPGGRGITELTKQAIEALNLPGIDFIQDQKRYYPNGDFASYIVGYAKKNEDGSLIGEMGIETMYDDILKGTDGYEEYQQDLNGYKIPDTKEFRTEPINGSNIYLTIDASIQRFLEQAVKNNSNQYKPEWMVMAVMDAKTGDILGSASTPSFDPNVKNITNYENPLSSFLFEPGSTMKIYTYMCAMEKGVYDGNTMYDSGKYKIDEYTVQDWNSGYGWGKINYDLGFEYSSNVAIANILNTVLTKDDLKECFRKYGFSDATGIELGRELYRDFTFNYDIEVANAGFGQGILTTPIQHLQGLTILGNDGYMLKPHIVSRIVDSNTDEVIYERQIEKTGTSVDIETVNKIKSLMYNVVNANNVGTTGTLYKVDGLDIIGKTGTAQIYDDKNGGYLTGVNDYIYSFAGMYPYDNPEIIIYAAIKKPNLASTTSLSGSVVEVMKNISKYKNINTGATVQTSDIKEYKLDNYLNKNVSDVIKNLKEKNVNVIKIGDGDIVTSYYPNDIVLSNDRVIIITDGNNYLMPNMTNWSKREVKYLFDTLGLKYKFNGSGYVKEQSIKENTVINKEQEVLMLFANKFDDEKKSDK